MAGYIKIYREIREHWIWSDPKSTQWWLDLIMLANFKESKILLNGELRTIERGTFHTSELKLSARWSVSRTSVNKFLTLLENDKMITTIKDKKGTTITICNYNDYQGFDEEEKQQNRQQKNNRLDKSEAIEKQQKNNKLDTTNNDNKGNNSNKGKNEEKETLCKVLNSYAPNGELREALQSFIEMRQKAKKPLTARAFKQRLKALDELSCGDEITKIAIVDQTLNKGWLDFYELKIESRNTYKQQNNKPSEEYLKWLQEED